MDIICVKKEKKMILLTKNMKYGKSQKRVSVAGFDHGSTTMVCHDAHLLLHGDSWIDAYFLSELYQYPI